MAATVFELSFNTLIILQNRSKMHFSPYFLTFGRAHQASRAGPPDPPRRKAGGAAGHVCPLRRMPPGRYNTHEQVCGLPARCTPAGRIHICVAPHPAAGGRATAATRCGLKLVQPFRRRHIHLRIALVTDRGCTAAVDLQRGHRMTINLAGARGRGRNALGHTLLGLTFAAPEVE